MRALGMEPNSTSGSSVNSARSLASDSQSIDKNFRRAVDFLANPSSKPQGGVSNEDKLRLYALYKQGEQGSCQGSRPGMFDPVGRAKYDAWKSLGSMSREDAKRQYVEEVTRLLGALPLSFADSADTSTPQPPSAASTSGLSSAQPQGAAFPAVPSLRELMGWRASVSNSSISSGDSASSSARTSPVAGAPAASREQYLYHTLQVSVDEHGVGSVVLS
eukprot:gene40623-49528_t